MAGFACAKRNCCGPLQTVWVVRCHHLFLPISARQSNRQVCRETIECKPQRGSKCSKRNSFCDSCAFLRPRKSCQLEKSNRNLTPDGARPINHDIEHRKSKIVNTLCHYLLEPKPLISLSNPSKRPAWWT